MKNNFSTMKLMLVLLIGLITASTLFAGAAQLKNFDGIFNALKTGNTVKAIFHYKNCKLISENEEVEDVPDAIGGMKLETFEYFAKGSIRNKKAFISSSKTVLINHPRYGYVYNYAKVRIYDDGKIQIIAQYVSPKTYEIKMDESFYTVINDGKNKGGAIFYLSK